MFIYLTFATTTKPSMFTEKSFISNVLWFRYSFFTNIYCRLCLIFILSFNNMPVIERLNRMIKWENSNKHRFRWQRIPNSLLQENCKTKLFATKVPIENTQEYYIYTQIHMPEFLKSCWILLNNPPILIYWSLHMCYSRQGDEMAIM